LALQLSPRPNDILESNANLKQVEVFVCTETCAFSGYAYCGTNQRLLDTLNQNVIANSMPFGKEFLPLVQVEVCFPNGTKKTTREAIIRKSNILFVGEKDEELTAAPGIKDRPLMYPMRPKTPLAVEIHLPSYILMGQIYGEAWQQILDVVDRADKFIALTNVDVLQTPDNAALKFCFVAVNRDKMIYIGEPANSIESPLPIS
jgi:hypothetical protein